MPVAVGFSARFVFAKDACSGAAKGATANPGGSDGQRFELDPVACGSHLARTLKSLANEAKGIYA